jgi:predicted acylesterase/phospholipase RssA
MDTIRGLAFEGGGMAGNGLAGGYMRLLESIDDKSQLKVFPGTSAGSINAAAASVRASAEWIKKKLESTDFTAFMDSSWNPLDNTMRVIQDYGWYKGDVFETWVAHIMEELTGKHDITFYEAHIRYGTTLIITKVDVLYPRCKLVIMDWQSHPNEPIYKAIRASCSIPYIFKAVKCDGHLFVDGGVLLNYPIELAYKYLPTEQVIGMRLVSAEGAKMISNTVDERPVRDHLEFIMSIATTVRELAMKNTTSSNDHTCNIPVNVGVTDFNATREQLAMDFQNGYDAMDQFIKKLMPLA